MCDRLRSAVDIAHDIHEALADATANNGLSTDELHTFATTIHRHQHRTARIPEMAIQHGANRLHNPDGLPARQLAAHSAACLAIAESVLTGVAEAGYLIARPPALSLCPDHGLPRCTRCVHDGVDHV